MCRSMGGTLCTLYTGRGPCIPAAPSLVSVFAWLCSRPRKILLDCLDVRSMLLDRLLYRFQTTIELDSTIVSLITSSIAPLTFTSSITSSTVTSIE